MGHHAISPDVVLQDLTPSASGWFNQTNVFSILLVARHSFQSPLASSPLPLAIMTGLESNWILL